MLGRRLTLIMFNLILGPSRILSLRRLKHDWTLRKGHLRWILSIMCPSILLNLLDLVDLRLPVIDRLHLQRVVRAHSRRMGLVKLLGRAHNEVVVVSRRRRVHGFHYKVVPFVFLVEGTVPRRGTLLQLLKTLVCQWLRGLCLNIYYLFWLSNKFRLRNLWNHLELFK